MTPLSRRTWIAASIAAAAAPAAALAAPKTTGQMRAYEVGDAKDGQITMHLVKRPIPQPGPGEVLVKVHATGLNARDLSLLRRVRIYGGAGDSTSLIPLDDNACEVVALGSGVTRVQKGDRVMATHFPLWVDGPWNDDMSKIDFSVNRDGFLAEYAVVGADGLVKIPEALSYEAASTLPNPALTAWHAVVGDTNVKRGETVVTLGTGGVSMFGFQFAKYFGARVIVTSSSDEKLAKMRALGADMTINYRNTPEWQQEVIRLTNGRGADVVLNTVGIGEMERCINACASNGRISLIGANPVRRTGTSTEMVGLKDFPRNMIMRGLTIKGTVVGSRKMLEDLTQACVDGKIAPVIDRVFPFEKALDAVRYMEAGEKIGKIVIKVA